MPQRPNADQIRQAAQRAGLRLNDTDINHLATGSAVSLQPAHIAPQATCSGIKIIDLGNKCGLYVNAFPPTITVCCEI